MQLGELQTRFLSSMRVTEMYEASHNIAIIWSIVLLL